MDFTWLLLATIATLQTTKVIASSLNTQLSFNDCSIVTETTVTTKASVSGLSTCGADSFLLRDSACDEATNNELCLYDGGDCCLEAKITTHCKNCSCILKVDQNKLLGQFKELEVAVFKTNLDIDTDWSVKVEDVISGYVCAVLCLDHDSKDQINTWRYNLNTRQCKCGWTESTKCPENLVQEASIDNLLAEKSYVQLKKTVPCGNKIALYYCIVKKNNISCRMFCCWAANQPPKNQQR